uniref:Uncharacterized protein n=1 Tax=uncultured marine virus TaxID=186617 RepID=A0A0F7L3D5_9VIRU|nr:hypothetical protein [uncultured marine virus]
MCRCSPGQHSCRRPSGRLRKHPTRASGGPSDLRESGVPAFGLASASPGRKRQSGNLRPRRVCPSCAPYPLRGPTPAARQSSGGRPCGQCRQAIPLECGKRPGNPWPLARLA